MRRQGRTLDLAAVFDEDELPLQIIAFRTPEGVALETKKRRIAVCGYRHQRHINIACHAKHRTDSFADINPNRSRRTIVTSRIKNV